MTTGAVARSARRRAGLVTRTRDAASRLTTVTDWDSNVTSYSYDDAGRMTLVELPNGVETSYTYDDGDRLTDIEHKLGCMGTLNGEKSTTYRTQVDLRWPW